MIFYKISNLDPHIRGDKIVSSRTYEGNLPGKLGLIQRRIVKCRVCTRLVEHREKISMTKRAFFEHCDYWGAPVPSNGDPKARVLIIGLAPGAHGANRTGRMFTGDPSATFLTSALYRTGFATLPDSSHVGDGLSLKDVFITSALHCVPPQDKAVMLEQNNCRDFLIQELHQLRGIKAVLALGKVAFDNYVKAVSVIHNESYNLKFGHNLSFDMSPKTPMLFCSYHPSPRNTYTKRLDAKDLDAILFRIKDFLLKTSG